MGYTHYWEFVGKRPGVLEVSKILRPLIEHGFKNDILGNWEGKKRINYTAFNGLKPESCETFRPISEDSFCKTNYKPYDSYVIAALFRLKKEYGNRIVLSSDGNEGDLFYGSDDNLSPVELYKEIYHEEPPSVYNFHCYN